MSTRDQRIAAIARRQHGAFSRAQALSCRFTVDQIRGRIEAGLWLRIHRGVYAIGGAPSTLEGATLAAVLAAGDRAVASHETAARLWQLPGTSTASIHVSIRGRQRRRVPGVRIHLPRTLSPRDTTRIGAIPVTTAARTLCDLASSVVAPALEDALDDALRRDLVTVRSMNARLRSVRKNGRRGLPVLERLVEDRIGEARSESRLETAFRRLLRDNGLPRPVAQYEIRSPDGTFVARVDFAYPQARLAIEVDGYAHHSSRRDWERDRVRQNRLVALGWAPVRVTASEMTERPDDVLALIWRHLAGSGAANRHQSSGWQRSGVT